MSKLEHASLPAQIADVIHERIYLGEYRQGQPIVESALARELATSQSAVREAERLLQGRGYLDHASNKGTRVASLSEKDIDDLVVVRTELETIGLDLARANATDQDKTNLDGLSSELVVASESGDLLDYYRTHLAFHLALFATSGNSVLSTEAIKLLDKHFTFSHYPILNKEPRIKSGRWHKKLLDYVGDQSNQTSHGLAQTHLLVDTGYTGYLKSA